MGVPVLLCPAHSKSTGTFVLINCVNFEFVETRKFFRTSFALLHGSKVQVQTSKTEQIRRNLFVYFGRNDAKLTSLLGKHTRASISTTNLITLGLLRLRKRKHNVIISIFNYTPLHNLKQYRYLQGRHRCSPPDQLRFLYELQFRLHIVSRRRNITNVIF